MEPVEKQMSARDERESRAWSLWKVVCVIFVVAFAVYWPLRTEYLYEEDSVGFAFCVRHFDIGLSDPHPPGYPLWLVAANGLTRIVGSPNTAMILLSICFTAGAAVFVYLLACRLQGALAAAFITGLFLFTPNVMLHSAMATTYTVDLFTSSLAGWFAARLWEGEKKLAPWAVGMMGLLAGVRLAGVVQMAPLLAVSLLIACRADWRLWLRSAVVCAVAVSSWFFPLAHCNDGIGCEVRNLWEAIRWLFWYLIERSAFGGTAVGIHSDRLIRAAIWFSISLFVPFCLLLCVSFVRKCARLRSVATMPRPVWHCWFFYTAWGLPNAIMISLFLCLKPCYLNPSLPPLLLCLGIAIHANLLALGQNAKRRRAWPSIAVLAGFVLASVAIASFPFGKLPNSWLGRFRHDAHMASLRNLRESDRTLQALISLTGADRGLVRDQLFIAIHTRWTEMGSAKASYYFPDCPVGEQEDEELVETLYGNWPTLPIVPPRTRKIWWILRRSASADWILSAFPETTLMFEGEFTSFYCTEIGRQTFDVQFSPGENTWSLRRDVVGNLKDGRGD